LNNNTITARALKAEIAFWQAMAVEKLACDGITAIATNLKNSAGLNLVIDTQLPNIDLDITIKKVIDFYKSRELEWQWIIGPLTQPSNLADYLQKHGLIFSESFPGMYFNLSSTLPTHLIENFSIKEADDLSIWIKPVAEAFQATDNGMAYQTLNSNIPHGAGAAFRHFVGYYLDEPVSAVTLFIHDDAVMIHNLATKKDFLKRGFGSAMTIHAMKIAKNLGKQHCFLDASNDGINLYQKIGFNTYCIYNVYSTGKRT